MQVRLGGRNDGEDRRAEYATSGEMVTRWSQQGIRAVDVVIPGSQLPSSRVSGSNKTLRYLTVEALFSVAKAPGQ